MRKILILVLIFAGGAWAAGSLKVLQAFGTGSLREGSDLYAGVIMDASGNLYGVAESGGTYGAGVVYELSRTTGGAWSETVLYNFKGGADDGANPHATLMRDGAGNLYGTTVAGGLTATTCRTGCGAVFMLTAVAGGWQESVLYRFPGGAGGSVPYAGVVMDSAGSLYGATLDGGASAGGMVYKLSPGSAGWTQTVLYSFGGRPDGSAPYPTPVLDAAGNLYGATNTGGAHNLGIVYMLAPQPDGAWTEQVLHSFAGGSDGANPLAGVIFDRHGNLYGTTSYGGTANCGIAFALAPNPEGGWTEHLLHTFLGVTAYDGENPNGLTFDAAGNLYGTTTGGGTDNPGTIFEITHSPSAGWQETVLYNFTAGDDGAYPSSGVVLDPAGNIYGTTLWGGPSGDTTGGVAFQFTP
ncbi:MAG TPA: choice-of-anchor tandem repeat GloVer-containing protein [Bryobacteraceae bacterium]|nr:choice-of-anchor tandem repeat GloVer-containing protein [Bryobacteraceae bacterium]